MQEIQVTWGRTGKFTEPVTTQLTDPSYGLCCVLGMMGHGTSMIPDALGLKSTAHISETQLSWFLRWKAALIEMTIPRQNPKAVSSATALTAAAQAVIAAVGMEKGLANH